MLLHRYGVESITGEDPWAKGNKRKALPPAEDDGPDVEAFRRAFKDTPYYTEG